MKRKRGGQPGNKNAVGNRGGGSPHGNKNAVSTHEYEKITYDTLTEEERRLLEDLQFDPLALLEDCIRLSTIREYRMLCDIKKYRSKPEMSEAEITKSEIIKAGKVIQEEKTVRLLPTIDKVMALEDTLTRVQNVKIKTLGVLMRLHLENRKTENTDKGNVLVDDWIKGVMGDDSTVI